jgi:predicted lysophospholipase L1 biosynthesis ABC-type transport system permease subunit
MDGNKMSKMDARMEQLRTVKRGHRAVYLFVALSILMTAMTFGFDERFGTLFVYGMIGAYIVVFIGAMAMEFKAQRIVRSIMAGR